MTQRHLDGKVAIVTGGLARHRPGDRGALRGRGRRRGRELRLGRRRTRRPSSTASRRAGGDAIAVRADVSQAGDARDLVAATMEHFGRIDILVNNAGVMVAKGVLETSEDDWDRTIDVNLKGPYLLSKEVAPIMIRQEAGTIINMSSNSGLYHPSAMRFTEYVVSKAGLNGLTKALALALGPHITVNAICPGWIRTDMLEEVDPEVHQRILAETALARWGTPEDIAASAVFLASPRPRSSPASCSSWPGAAACTRRPGPAARDRIAAEAHASAHRHQLEDEPHGHPGGCVPRRPAAAGGRHHRPRPVRPAALPGDLRGPRSAGRQQRGVGSAGRASGRLGRPHRRRVGARCSPTWAAGTWRSATRSGAAITARHPTSSRRRSRRSCAGA